MAGRLEGKVVLVTGGSTGIGQATSLILAREGARVAVADIAVEAANRTVDLIKKEGGEACFIQADVSRATEVEALIAKVVTVYSRLDGAFNNAGIEGELASTVDCTEENFDRTIAVNLKGVWLCLRAEIRQMLRQGGGAIVNTASAAGLVGFSQAPAYGASKFGVVGLTKTAALEYAEQGVRVNAVCPGVIQTPMVDRIVESGLITVEAYQAMEPMRRFGKPAEIGEAVAWLLSDQASFVTGVALPVDGGFVAQ